MPRPMTDDEREAREERAAIMEYDGGMSREDAEREAGLLDADDSVPRPVNR